MLQKINAAYRQNRWRRHMFTLSPLVYEPSTSISAGVYWSTFPTAPTDFSGSFCDLGFIQSPQIYSLRLLLA